MNKPDQVVKKSDVIDGNGQCLNTETFPIGLVVSRFNDEITQALKEGAIERLKERGFAEAQIQVIEVPGAVEIPLAVTWLLQTKNTPQAVIALGAVIRGDTTHYDYVCQQVSYGCQRVALDSQVPVIFGILTTENETQAWERVGGTQGHKGREAADTAISMQQLRHKLWEEKRASESISNQKECSYS